MPNERPLQSGATDFPNAPQSSVQTNEDAARAAGYEVQHQAPQYRRVKGPEGYVRFPASMSVDDISSAMQKMYPPTRPAPTGEIRQHNPSLWERAQNVVPVLKGDWLPHMEGGQLRTPAMAPEDASQLAYPERAMTPAQQTAHPILTGAGEFAGGLTTPDNLLATLTLAKAPVVVGKLAGMYFTGQMAKGAYDGFLAGADQWKQGNVGEAERLWTHAGLNLLAARLAVKHMTEGRPAPPPETTPIGGTGKTPVDVKAQTATPSRVTGSPPVDIRQRINEIKAQLEAARARELAAKPPKAEDEVEAIRRGAPAAPAPTPPAPNLVPEAARASTVIKAEAAKKFTERVESRGAEKAALEKPPSTFESNNALRPPVPNVKSYSGYQIVDGMKEVRQKTTIPERPAGLDATSPEAVAAARRRLALRKYQLDVESAGQGGNPPARPAILESTVTDGPTSSPEVGRQSAPAKTPRPENESVQTSQAATSPGKPVQDAAKQAVEAEPRSSRGEESKPQVAKVFNVQERLNLQRTRVEELAKQYPGVSKTRLAEMASDQIRKEMGAFGGGGPEDINQRREAKINEWTNQLRDPKTDPKTLDTAYKMLKAYGLEHEEIVERAGGKSDPLMEALGRTEFSRLKGKPEDIKAFAADLGVAESSGTGPALDYYRRTPDDLKQDFFDTYQQFKNQIRAGTFGFGDLVDRIKGHPDRYEEPKPLGTSTASGAKFDQDTFAKVKLEHPEWTMSQQLQEAAKRVSEARGIPSSKEGLEERMGELPPDQAARLAKVQAADKEWLGKQDAWAQEQHANIEGSRAGAGDIGGVMSPGRQADTDELNRLYKLRDERAQTINREGERGSFSFRRLTSAQKAAANPVTRLADALDRVAEFFDRRSVEGTDAANIIRAATSERSRSNLEVEAALSDAIKRHDSPINERDNFKQFMDAGEGKPGAQFLNPEDQALATALHEMFEERWDKIKAVKGLEGDGIENYLSHIWEKSNKAQGLLSGILTGRRPLEGSAKFLKNRFYQYASQGIDHGLTPVTWNPVRLQLAALFDTDRFLMAHDIKDDFVDAKLARWVKLSDYKNVPAGWSRLDDKIFQPKAMGEGALMEYGTYYAPAEVAKIFNNYLSPGLRGNAAFRNFRNYGNALNMISLGVSAYHGTMISLVSATSDLSLGMQKIANYGDYTGGLRDMVRGTFGTFAMRSAITDYRLGRSIMEEAVQPTGNQALQRYVNAITKGGGRFKQDAFYSNSWTDRSGVGNWFKLATKGKFLEMAQTGVRKMAGPIMEKFVPNIKLGAAAKMMEAKLAHLDKQGVTDQFTVATELGKIWDSVDNRAGQMAYDNLFWNKAVKDIAFTAVRAVGWDLGSIREYGGAATIDLPRQMAKALRGERPELTSRLAFTIATPITIGIMGGAMHYFLTGQAPKTTEDYYFPGPQGAKISFPTYMKDFYALHHPNDPWYKLHPLDVGVNKLHPTFSQMIDFYHNSDFYGTEIYHPGDPTLKQGWDTLKWMGRSFELLSFKGISKRIERGEPTSNAVGGFMGFMPAPGYVGQSKAERLALELSIRDWKRGPRTEGDADRYALTQRYEHAVGAGQKIDPAQLRQDWIDRKLQTSDIAKIYSNYNTPRLSREFKQLALPDALAVMREASPDERQQLKPLLLGKYVQIWKYDEGTRQGYDREIRAYLK